MLEKILNSLTKNTAAILLSASLATAAGCTTYLPINQQSARKAEPMPKYVYEHAAIANVDSATKKLKHSNEYYEEYTVSLLTKGEIVAQFESIESKVCGKKNSWVIMYPILGGDDLLVVGNMARNVLAEKGINSAILLRKGKLIGRAPYRPLKSEDPSIVDFEDYQYDAVKDTFRILQYLKKQDMKEFGLLGFSLGGMQVAGAAGFLPESKVNIMVMAGGDLSDIIMNSTEDRVEDYKQYLVNFYHGEDKAKKALSELETEPLKFAKYLSTAKARMIITTCDDVVPTRCQWELYRALGGPKTMTVLAGHYTIALYYSQVKNFILDEVQHAFEHYRE